MKQIPLYGKFLLFGCIAALSTSSALSAFVTWELNPNGLEQNAGSAVIDYTVSGNTITARGFTNTPGFGTALELYYKQEGPIAGAGEHGLGIVGPPDHELQVNGDGTPAQFIQLDLRSILSLGFTGGELSVGSIQTGESFRLFGSNAQGVLGTQLPGTWGSAFDEKFVAIPNFGAFQFVSIAALNADVLPVAFRATPVPEMNALLPIIGLLVAVSSAQILRRRRSLRP